MLVLKLVSISPKKTRSFLIIITSEERIIDIINSEKGHQGAELAPFKSYRLFYLDILQGTLSSVSFFHSDLTPETSILPLYKDFQDDCIGNESSGLSEDTLSITITLTDKANPFGEEDLRFSIENQYKIDDEPLVEFTSRDSMSERQSMMSGLVTNQLNHYKKLLEAEKKLRTKLESINEEICQKFEAKTQNFHQREKEYIQEISYLSQKVQVLNTEISELKISVKTLQTEKIQINELKDLTKTELSSLKKLDYFGEICNYREILEEMDKKWKEFSGKIETSHDTDPIHFIIKEKDETIAGLQTQILAMQRESLAAVLENEMKKRNLSFIKENELVYLVENSKVVVSLDSKILSFRKIGGLKPIDELTVSPPQKRSNSSFRSDLGKKSLKAPILSSKSPAKYS